MGVFSEITKLVESAKRALSEPDFITFGWCLRENQGLLSQLNVSSLELDRLISVAEQSGSDGAKLSGAGGGDCMIAVADDQYRKRISEAIEQAGGMVQEVRLHAPGVRIEQ